MSGERPDFTVDSKGNTVPDRAEAALAVLDIATLINAARSKGNRNSEAFIAELALLIASKRKVLDDLYPRDGSAASLLIYDSVFRSLLERTLKDEDVSYATFQGAWRKAFNLEG